MASGTRVYVGNLLAGVDKGELQKEFSRFGKLREVWVARNPPGFAFVEFFAYVDAERAVSSLDGRHLLGSKVTVQMSRKPLKRGRDGRMRQGAGPHRQGGRRPMPRPDMRYRGERNPPMSKPPPRAASPGYDPPLNRPRPVKPMNTKSFDLAKSRIAKKLTQRSRINVLRKRPAPAGKFTKTGRKLSQGGTLPVQKNVRSARTSSSDYEDDRPTKATAVQKKMNVSQKVAKIKKKKAVKKVGKHAPSRSMDRSSRSQSPYERPPPRHVGPSTPPRSPCSWSPRRWTPSPPRRNTSPRPMINPSPMPLMRNRRSPPPPYADKRRRNQSPVPRWSPSAVPLRYPSPPPRDNYYNYSPASEYNMPWRDPVYPYDERWQGEGMKRYPSQSRPRSRSPPSPPRERFDRRGMMPGYFPDYWPPFPPIPPPPPPMDSRYLGSRQSPPPRYPSRDSPPVPSRQRRTPEKYRERSPVSPARSPNIRSKGKLRQRTRSDSSPESVVIRKGSKKYASPGVKLKRKQRRSYSNSPPPKRGGHVSSDDSRSPSPKYEKWPQESKRRSRTPQKYRQSPPRRYRSASRSPGSVEYKRRNSYSDNSRSPTPRRGWNSTRSRPKSPSPQRWSKSYKDPSNYRSRSPSPLPDTRSQRTSNSLRKSYQSPPESRKASRRSLTPNSPPPRAYRSVTPSPPRSKYKGSRRR